MEAFHKITEGMTSDEIAEKVQQVFGAFLARAQPITNAGGTVEATVEEAAYIDFLLQGIEEEPHELIDLPKLKRLRIHIAQELLLHRSPRLNPIAMEMIALCLHVVTIRSIVYLEPKGNA